ncbi:MAG: metallophosphoesterase [Gemmatimonadaceae bacterium]
MRTAIIADVHGNRAALRAVIADARRTAVRQIVCLGDLVGHNALPRETLELMRAAQIPSVVGNHDLMAIGQLEPDDCEPGARAAILWTRTVLSAEDVEYLRQLPDRLMLEPDGICVHSGLGDPVARLSTPDQFREQLTKLRRLDARLRVCFTGHTHVPGVVEVSPSGPIVTRKAAQLRLRSGSFYFVNPGTVGAPRGIDYRASYAVYDRDAATVFFRRVAYDKHEIVRANTRHGLETNNMELSLPAYAMRTALRTVRRAGARLKAAL